VLQLLEQLVRALLLQEQLAQSQLAQDGQSAGLIESAVPMKSLEQVQPKLLVCQQHLSMSMSMLVCLQKAKVSLQRLSLQHLS
jgi:hypothetical protein